MKPGAELTRKVAIVDDHTMMREGLAQLVNSHPGYVCCWTAGDLAEAIRCLGAERPDLPMADMTLPGRNGLGSSRMR